MTPFTVDVPQSDLDDLRDRLVRTRWAGDFGGDSWDYGTNGVYLRELVDYWLNGYDWRATERAINAFANFREDVSGTPIHFIHERGKGPNPIPLVLTHGWPWTFWDFKKVIGPLTDPSAYGGDAKDAFDVIVPSLPGYGFSTPATRGIAYWEIADLWVELMDRLGYGKFGAVGGDWGAFVSAQLGHKYADRMLGVHIQLLVPLDIAAGGDLPTPEDFAPDERPWIEEAARFRAGEYGYALLQKTKPRTHSFSANDSPAGLLAWIVEKRRTWSGCGGDVERCFSKDELIDTAMIYWITQSFGSAARLYYESAIRPWTPSHQRRPVVEAPTAVPVFPDEVMHQPRKWAERYYNLQRWTPMPGGGHFGPMEQPETLVSDIRAFFGSLR